MTNSPLAGKSFELVANHDGHASESTVMKFDASGAPITASYKGANIVCGHALVAEDEMLYHALDLQGNLSAGKATIRLDGGGDDLLVMSLRWSWLTGDRTGGTSVWREIRN